MEKIGAYKILPKFKLIVEYYAGNIIMDDFIHLKRVISSEHSYNPNFTSVLDFRDAEINVDENDMIRYLSFLKEFKKALGNRKTAYLITTPNEVALTTYFSLIAENSDVPLILRIFSTINALNRWIDIKGINNNSLISFLEELKTQPNNVYKK